MFREVIHDDQDRAVSFRTWTRRVIENHCPLMLAMSLASLPQEGKVPPSLLSHEFLRDPRRFFGIHLNPPTLSM